MDVIISLVNIKFIKWYAYSGISHCSHHTPLSTWRKPSPRLWCSHKSSRNYQNSTVCISYTLAMLLFVFNMSLLCVLDSKEFLSEIEEERSSCVRISVHSFNCCIPLTLLCRMKEWQKRSEKCCHTWVIVCCAVLCWD